MTSVGGVTVQDCFVSESESGLNLQQSTNITIDNLTVFGSMDDGYGVRAGQGSGPVNTGNTMVIKNSRLEAKYPVWLRQGAPETVIIVNCDFSEDDIRDDTAEKVNIVLAVYNQTQDTYHLTLKEAIAAAKSGDTICIYKDADFFGFDCSNKDLTFVGIGDSPTLTFPQSSYKTYSGCEFTFINLTLRSSETNNYQGIQPQKLRAIGCVIKGKLWGYAVDMEFTDCTFIQESDDYNIWTYGSNVTFDNCEFYCNGRSVLIYNEGVSERLITIKNCTFNATAVYSKKAAIEIDSRFGKFVVVIEGCQASGFDTVADPENNGIALSEGLVNLKYSDNVKGLTLKIDGDQVYPVSTSEE